MDGKYRIITFGLLMIMHLGCQGQPFTSLDQFRWKNRILVINTNTIVAQEQMMLLKDEIVGLQERDLIVLHLVQDSVLIDKVFEPLFPGNQLRKDLELSTAFECLLIGKDGGVKNRTSIVKSPSFYYGLIDQMPMRKQEIRDNP